MAENKVRFGLKNVHYAVLTITATTSGESASWGTPVSVPGAVTLTLDPVGDITPFYADNITYYKSIANNGYSGSLEMARISDAMRQAIWGDNLGTTSKVLTEKANVEPKPFALLFQIDGDADNEYYCLYNVSGTRPGIGSTTNTDTKTPQTQTVNITASPMSDGKVMARTTEATPAGTKSGWFSSVFQEA